MSFFKVKLKLRRFTGSVGLALNIPPYHFLKNAARVAQAAN